MELSRIIKKQQPRVYRKLRQMIVSSGLRSRTDINPSNFIQTNLGNTGLEYREQPEDPEDEYEFRRIQRLVTERKAVEI